MNELNGIVRTWLLITVLLLSILVVQSFVSPRAHVSANADGFAYVEILSSGYLYQGHQGVLLMDRRNGNIWFMARGNEFKLTFKDPVFLIRLPLEKLDQAPH